MIGETSKADRNIYCGVDLATAAALRGSPWRSFMSAVVGALPSSAIHNELFHVIIEFLSFDKCVYIALRVYKLRYQHPERSAYNREAIQQLQIFGQWRPVSNVRPSSQNKLLQEETKRWAHLSVRRSDEGEDVDGLHGRSTSTNTRSGLREDISVLVAKRHASGRSERTVRLSRRQE